MTGIGMITTVSGPRPAPAGKPSGQAGPADIFQSQSEVRLEVTPAMLHTTAFQQQLADYSARGIPVSVSLVSQRKALPAPTPPAPAPAPAPVAAPAQARAKGETAGKVGGVAGALVGSGCTVLGAVALNAAGIGGMGELKEALFHSGVLSLFISPTLISLPMLVCGGLGSGSATLGGLRLGEKVGTWLGRGESAAYVSEPMSRKQVVAANLMAGMSAIVGMAGGALAGISLSGIGNLFTTGVDPSQLSNPGVIAAAAAGAVVVGAMGFLGGRETGKNMAS